MAAAPSFKNPPSLTSEKTYQQWKNEVKMWQLVTDLDKKKRGLALALSLQGKPREVALEVDPADLNVNEGVEKLIEELDKLFEKDKVDQAYASYTIFDKFQRGQNMNMSDYIIEFEQRYNKCKRHDMVLPDAILAFKLLDNAGLNQSNRQMALTACNDLKFDTMKSALNRIFANKANDQDDQDTVVSVKEESAFLSERYYRERGRSSRRSFPRTRNDRSLNSQKSQSQMNPTINGTVSRCRICDSKYHWIRNCPHKRRDVQYTEEQEDETVHITLMTTSKPNLEPQSVFVAEAFNAAIIDTACSKTVCGEKWLHTFVESLDTEYKQVTFTKSKVPFKFGDGQTVYSFQKVKFPAKIGSTRCFIETEVVDCEIPLLLSKESLKKAHTVLDLENDKVTMFGQAIDVNLTSSGHYCVNIKDNDFSERKIIESDSEEILCIDSKFSVKKKKEILLKLHRQFGHASSEKLLSLLQSAGHVDSEVKSMLHEICSKCVICHKFKRPQSKPIVAFSHANDFNQIVAMDLHEIDHNFYYLHIIDLFSRLSAAAIIRSKDSRIIVDKFMQIWVSIYGAPEIGVYTDNGGEFNSQIFRDMAENLNMSVKTTAAYSPWSNGVVERHNATLTEMINKMKEKSNISWETAISWAINAKNSLLSVHGYSPYQIVFGRNPNLPSTIVDKPPALEGRTLSTAMGKHLIGLHEARKAFIAAESSEKVRRALRKQIRPSGEKFQNGDKVYFLRNNQWKGPGWVIGQDNVVVFIRYGGTYVRVHESRIRRDIDIDKKQKTAQCNKQNVSNHANGSSRPRNEYRSVPLQQNTIYESDEDDEIENGIVEGGQNGYSTDEDGAISEHHSETGSSHGSSRRSSRDSSHNSSPGRGSHDSSVIGTDNNDIENETDNDNENLQSDTEVLVPTAHSLKKDQTVSFKVPGESTSREATILSRAGKASTDKKSWYNIEFSKPENLEGEQISIDLSTVDNLRIVEQEELETEDVFFTNINFTDAKQVELSNWIKHDVFEEIDDNGQQCVSTRWVCTTKDNGKEILHKARLVAKGFEEDCLDDIQKNSPTCEKQSLRLILSIIANKKWKINSIDIKTAFLQGEKMQREVYIRPPKEAAVKGKIWRLNKCVYGLADASLKWYEKVKKTLLQLGGTVSKVDPAVFYWHNTRGLSGVLAVHVDDFLWAGTNSFERDVIVKVRDLFKVGKEESESFKYLGLCLEQDNDKIVLSQKDYVNNLKTVPIDCHRAKTSPLSPSEKTLLRSKVGQLLWLSKQTRPDIAFDVANISSRIMNSTVEDLKRINKLIKKVQHEQVSLCFKDLGSQLEILLFSDASFGNLPDGGSQGGYIVFLMGKDGYINPIAWQSRKIRRIVRSTLASEALALADGVDCAISLSILCNELLHNSDTANNVPIRCVIDNKDLYHAIYSSKQVVERRLRLEISALKQMIQNGEIAKVNWTSTMNQVADVFTKHGASGHNILCCLRSGHLKLS